MPAIKQGGWLDDLAGFWVVFAADGNRTDYVDCPVVAGGEDDGVVVLVGGGEAGDLQGGHAGGGIREAEVVNVHGFRKEGG